MNGWLGWGQERAEDEVMLRRVMILTGMTALAAAAVWWMLADSAPDEVRALPLCERTWVLEFNSQTKLWTTAETPRWETIVCEMEGVTGSVSLDTVERAYIDTPLEGQTMDVPCFRRARMMPNTLPLRMLDGKYCNVPVPSARRK